MGGLSRGAIFLILLVIAILLWRDVRARGKALDQPAVVTQVRQLNQLATVHYTVQKVVDLTEQKQPLGSERILLVMQASVQAGIELSGIQPGDIEVKNDRTVVVRLPPARILNVFVDDKNTRVWDRQKTWWTPWVPFSLDLEKEARLKGLDAIKQEALSMGILHQAQENAKTSIRGLLDLAGAKTVLFPSS